MITECLIAGFSLIFSGIIGIISFVFIDYLKKTEPTPSPEETASGLVNEKTKLHLDFRNWKSSMTRKRTLSLCTVLLLNCYSYYRVFTFDLNIVTVIKIFIVLAFLMSAMFIDKETKKIPNLLILTMIGTEIIFILLEFLFQRNVFLKLLLFSGIGFIGCFLFMVLFSLLSKGGMGMGDVKLVAALGLLMGISGAFYTFIYAEILCFFAALFMIFLAKKNLKYVLPFAPFLYFGFTASVIFGTF